METPEPNNPSRSLSSASATPSLAEKPAPAKPSPWLIALMFLTTVGLYHVNLHERHSVDTVPAPYVAWNLLHAATFEFKTFPPELELYREGGASGHTVIRQGREGRYISKYPPGSAIMATPFFAVASIFARKLPGKPTMLHLGKAVGAFYCAAATVLVFLIVRRLFPSAALLSTIFFGLGTGVYSTASQSLWMHGPAVFCVCAALYFLLTPGTMPSWKQGLLAGLALGMSVLCRPALVLLLGAVALGALVGAGWKCFAMVALGSVAPIAFLLVYNLYYVGSLLAGAYGWEATQWTTPLVLGLAGLLIAPSRGLLFFSPAVIVAAYGAGRLFTRSEAVSRKDRALLIAGVFGSLAGIAFYARWWCWSGGWCYGPRFLIEIMPFVALFFAAGYRALSRPWTKAAAIALVLLSVAVNAVGVFARDDPWHARHYLAPYQADLFQFKDNQIWSSVVMLNRRIRKANWRASLDDGEPGYAETGSGWTTGSLLGAFHDDYRFHRAGSGSNTASWIFDGLQPGTYEVSATWTSYPNRASNAAYAVYDGAVELRRISVDQRAGPDGRWSWGVGWQTLGVFEIGSGSIVVQLSDEADGVVIADAVMIEAVP